MSGDVDVGASWLRVLAAAGLLATLSCGSAEDGQSGSDSASCNGGKCDDADGEEGFEFIIVGSGAGGGPLAANLARNGHRVLLLEAGQDMGGNPNYDVPAFHAASTEDPAMRWDFFVDHYTDEERQLRDSKITLDEDGNPKGVLYPRSGALGGCTAHNAMITVKPHDSDWQAMADLTGDGSWQAAEMDPYFERVAAWLDIEFADPTLVLFDLRLKQIITAGAAAIVNDGESNISLFDLIGDFGELLRLVKDDVNETNVSQEGAYLFPQAIRDGKRNGTREYLLETVEEGFPLTIQTGAYVTNVVFADELTEGGDLKAVGVEFMLGDHVYEADPAADLEQEPPSKERVEASKEVILSAGAFNTPQLLQLSGIGAREDLEELGAEVKLDMPGVGKNLQDRYEVGVVGSVDDDFETIEDCDFVGDTSDRCFRQWLDGEGPYTTNGVLAALLKRSSSAEPDPNFFIFGAPGNFKGYYPGYATDAVADRRHFTWAVLEGHTHNRAGQVSIRSLDPRRTPHINFRYFDDGDTQNGEDDHDLQAMVDAIEFVRTIEESTNRLMIFDEFVEEVPGPDVDTREEIEEFVKDEAWGHHACCTVKMGDADDPDAVLDSRFRVRGTEGLRVVDASIFPRIPGLFIVVPIYMASEKATDVILEDWGETRIEENFPSL